MSPDNVMDLTFWILLPFAGAASYHSTSGHGPHWLIHGWLCMGVYFVGCGFYYLFFYLDKSAVHPALVGTAQVAFGAYWIYRWWKHDGNDRWKKFKKKLTESIQQVGGKLKVVPNPA